jgi:hypothetical protein
MSGVQVLVQTASVIASRLHAVVVRRDWCINTTHAKNAQSVDSTCACVTAGIACISSADGACVRARLFMPRGICRCMCVYAASEAAK